MKSYVSEKVKLQKSKKGGEGLYAISKIKKDQIIVDYEGAPGKFLTAVEGDKLYDEGNDFMMQVDDGHYFVATSEDELEDADFINHSCDPNCGIRGSLKIVAMRDIEPGEEITFDYAMSESSNYKMNCNCGAKNCRKVVSGDDWKIPGLSKRYKGYFSRYLSSKK